MSGWGLGVGDVVSVAGTSTYESLLVMHGAWQCGAAVNVVPVLRSQPSLTARELVRRSRILRPAAVYLEAAQWNQVDDPLAGAKVRLDERSVARHAGDPDAGGHAEGAWDWPPSAGSPDEIAIYQATSGTTGGYRIVPVTWRMLEANLVALAERLGLTERDSLVSWLPLYHDMGLVCVLCLGMHLRSAVTLIPPEHFARDPLLLARAIEERSGTMTASPTVGLALLQRALEGSPSELRLGSLKRIVCGADMVDLDVCQGLARAGARHALGSDVFAPGYGLAEATLAVSLREPGVPGEARATPPTGFAWRNGDWLPPLGGVAKVGRPLDGVEVKIIGSGPHGLGRQGEVGEILVAGPSVMSSYAGASAGDESVLAEGWLRTGDLGYLSQGELVVVGRLKDVIVVGGRNILPDDVERVVGALPGVRQGRVAALPMLGSQGEGLAVIAEVSQGSDVPERALRATVRRQLGVTPELARLVPKGTLPTTTSGKLRRTACRELLTDYERRPVTAAGNHGGATGWSEST